MNNSTSAKRFSKPSKSERAESARKRIKAPVEDGVEAQLAGSEASGEVENGINYDGTSHKTTPAETACVERVVLLPVESVNTTETADELASRVNSKMMGKLRRAFRKAGKSEASENGNHGFSYLPLTS